MSSKKCGRGLLKAEKVISSLILDLEKLCSEDEERILSATWVIQRSKWNNRTIQREGLEQFNKQI